LFHQADFRQRTVNSLGIALVAGDGDVQISRCTCPAAELGSYATDDHELHAVSEECVEQMRLILRERHW
jgi:hypothetical protein